ncbi:acyl-CoA thioesterase [Streptococcus oralis]|uniref:Thioesterase n=1 Tax=Streptococcus oralis subsp. tigurinus 2426 TaxID=1333865 RepID=S9R755_STROR|nr:hotdog domain-containing protein [Streptococcus oralis]EMG34228.1 thioesterase superfamily protein [Streptococcus oralis subsp. tigurinus 1366]EPX88693.1 thioesterase [Streptococcus oralis subsp. tigurinus 2425]EPX89491.1 thioesterase [Streptococcus oralis subsp. tigurinus 2426]
MLETRTIAIQDRYEERFQHCWGCGPKNDLGLHLKTYPSVDGSSCISRIKLENAYTGGVPSNVFGGMIATIFDCHGTASAAWFAHHQKGLELTESTVIGRFITARLEIDYLSPSPIEDEIVVTSTLEELGERKAIIAMEMTVATKVRAKAKMVAVAVKDHM